MGSRGSTLMPRAWSDCRPAFATDMAHAIRRPVRRHVRGHSSSATISHPLNSVSTGPWEPCNHDGARIVMRWRRARKSRSKPVPHAVRIAGRRAVFLVFLVVHQRKSYRTGKTQWRLPSWARDRATPGVTRMAMGIYGPHGLTAASPVPVIPPRACPATPGRRRPGAVQAGRTGTRRWPRPRDQYSPGPDRP